MTLTLAARYINARKARVLFNKMAPALQCMALLDEYRDLREAMREGNEFAESSMAYVELEFKAARAELRSAIRFNNAVEAA